MPITRFLFEQLRTEANAFLVGVQNTLIPRRRALLRSIRNSRDLYVNVACGPLPLDGFLNLDLHATAAGVVRWDCRWNLPVADGAAAGIRVEHFFEHLETQEEAPHFLRDCHRALQLGGVIRIIVPDAARFLTAYCNGSPEAFRELGFAEPFPGDLPTRMDVVNHTFHQWHEHRWGYDAENLRYRLEGAGFGQVQQMQFGCSLDPRLAADLPKHAPYSMYTDAVKRLTKSSSTSKTRIAPSR